MKEHADYNKCACKQCKRKLLHCECLTAHTLDAQTVNARTEHPDGNNPPKMMSAGPATVVYHGFGGEKVQYSQFDSLMRANEFTAFLNSDRIFDCVIPKHFLKKEKSC